MKSKQSMREFFARPDVIALQEIQKRNPHGSQAHREAFNQIKTLAAQVGAAKFIGEYQ